MATYCHSLGGREPIRFASHRGSYHVAMILHIIHEALWYQRLYVWFYSMPQASDELVDVGDLRASSETRHAADGIGYCWVEYTSSPDLMRLSPTSRLVPPGPTQCATPSYPTPSTEHQLTYNVPKLQ